MKIKIAILLLQAAMLNTAAQGTFDFQNFFPPLVDAPVFNVDGTLLEGTRYLAQLWDGPSADSLAPIGHSAPFFTGEVAGYFVGGPRRIDTVPPGALPGRSAPAGHPVHQVINHPFIFNPQLPGPAPQP
jgi:hypothetical protein